MNILERKKCKEKGEQESSCKKKKKKKGEYTKELLLKLYFNSCIP